MATSDTMFSEASNSVIQVANRFNHLSLRFSERKMHLWIYLSLTSRLSLLLAQRQGYISLSNHFFKDCPGSLLLV